MKPAHAAAVVNFRVEKIAWGNLLLDSAEFPYASSFQAVASKPEKVPEEFLGAGENDKM